MRLNQRLSIHYYQEQAYLQLLVLMVQICLWSFFLSRMLIDLVQIMKPFSLPKLEHGGHDTITFHSPIKLLSIFCFYKKSILQML